MKIKQTPADFRVEELPTVTPGDAGDFALYRLDKTGWTTFDALDVIRRRWNLDARRVSYGGLKDRHADTTQYFTVFRGPARDLEHQRIRVTHLGRVAAPYGPQSFRGNRFTVTVRGLTPARAASALAAVPAVRRVGVANYFDDQRFGSVGPDGRFVALELIRGRFEDALKLALVAPYEHDRADAKKEKAALARHWGDWPACKAALGKGHARSLVDYLVSHPADFRGATFRLRPDLLGLYLAAYQSHVWNRTLAAWLTRTVPSLDTLSLKLGPHPTPADVPAERLDDWFTRTLPLPSARAKPVADADWLPDADTVLAADGITLATMKVPGLDKPYFARGDRAVCLRPADLTADEIADDLNAGRRAVVLRFELPRGSYATMVVKRLTA